jgi:hypothetical protein
MTRPVNCAECSTPAPKDEHVAARHRVLMVNREECDIPCTTCIDSGFSVRRRCKASPAPSRDRESEPAMPPGAFRALRPCAFTSDWSIGMTSEWSC